MTTDTRPGHLPSLGSHERGEVGRCLQESLTELIALSLMGKQFHWNVVGPLFKPLHLQLDELVDAWRDLSDTVAERAVAIGFPVDGRAAAVVASGLDPVDDGLIDDRIVVRELARRVAEVAERIRARMNRLSDLDLASQDVLIEVVRSLEMQLWMIRAQFPQPHH